MTDIATTGADRMIAASKTPLPDPNPDVPQPANPTPAGPGPKPGGPTHPPTRYADAFDLALSLGPDVAVDLARPHKPRPPSKPPRKPTQTKPIRGAQSFALPVPLGMPRFGGDDRPVPGQPGPPPDPKPYPPPVVEPPPWVVSRRRLAELGCGPLYDVLPGGPR